MVSLLSGYPGSLLHCLGVGLRLFSLPLLLMATLWPGAVSASVSRPLRICVSDSPFPPFTHPTREAAGQRVVRQAVEHQGRAVEFVAQPWRRCLLGVERGLYAGVVGTTAALEYRSFLAFPRQAEAVDEQRSLGVTTLVVYRRVGSRGSWDGRSFRNVTGPVLYLSGRSTLKNILGKIGVYSVDSARNSKQLAMMLSHKRGSLAIDHQPEVEHITRMPAYQGHFEILPVPFGEAHVYFAVGLETYRQQRQLFEAIWAEIGLLRAEAPALARDKG